MASLFNSAYHGVQDKTRRPGPVATLGKVFIYYAALTLPSELVICRE